MAAVANKQLSLIFLEVNDVLIDSACEKLKSQIDEEEERLHGLYPDLSYSNSLFRKRALTHFFSKESMGYLKGVIDKTSEAAFVRIVFSGRWREEVDIEVLRNFVFADVFFRDLILDKTPDSDGVKDSGYGFILGGYKGRAIDLYLRENHKKWNLKSVLIIDSEDSDTKCRFPGCSHFVKKGLFSEQDASGCVNILKNIPFSDKNFLSEKQVETARFNQRDLSLSFL